MSEDSFITDDSPSNLTPEQEKEAKRKILAWVDANPEAMKHVKSTGWLAPSSLHRAVLDSQKEIAVRPSFSDTFMEVAEAVAKRSTCPRRHVGAVLVRDNRIIATGYNGSVPGGLHCDEAGCLMVNNHCRRTIHAELNVILQCAAEGISAKGASLFLTTAPCGDCTKLFTATGIEGIYYLDGEYVPEFTTKEIYGPDTKFTWWIKKFTYGHQSHMTVPLSVHSWPEVTGRDVSSEFREV